MANVLDFSIVQRPSESERTKMRSAFRQALEQTATTGMALEIQGNGASQHTISSRISGGYTRALRAKGFRVRTKWLPDKSAVLVWAEKMETTS